jgi:multicomponent Na+:H+ antiporter subunit E
MRKMNKVSFTLSFVILFSFWILLSGHFDFMHLFLGVICSLLVAYISHELLLGDIRVKNLGRELKRIMRFFAYLPWLLCQITLANIDVAYRVLHPKMPIEPRIINFKTNLKTDLALTILANSITLTPGTVTVDIKDSEYFVHALSKKAADGLLAGNMQARVKHIER